MMALRRSVIAAANRSILPAAYQRVEWVGNDGSSWVATDYAQTADNSEIDFEYMFTASQTGDGMLFGARGGTTGYKRISVEMYNNLGWYCGCGIVQYRNLFTGWFGELGTKYSGAITSTEMTLGSYSASPTDSYPAGTLPKLHIFSWNDNGTNAFINKGVRLYSLFFKENGVLAANFVPCYRKSDNEIGFYDTVARAFYGNSGTGTLLKGADV